MFGIKNLLTSVAALLNLMPGFLVLQKSEFIPPYDNNVIFLILSTFVGTVSLLIVLFNKEKIKSIPGRRINIITILCSVIFVVSLIIYSLLMSAKVKKDAVGAALLPIFTTQALKDIIDQSGSVDNYLKDSDTVTLKEHLSDHSSQLYIKYTEIVFIILYTLINALLVLSISVVSIRLSPDKNKAGTT